MILLGLLGEAFFRPLGAARYFFWHCPVVFSCFNGRAAVRRRSVLERVRHGLLIPQSEAERPFEGVGNRACFTAYLMVLVGRTVKERIK
jgi:hypothetical protein